MASSGSKSSLDPTAAKGASFPCWYPDQNDTPIRKSIKNTKKDLNKAVADALKEIAYFPRNVLEFKDYVSRYREVFEEANLKINNSRYVKSILFKLSSEKNKQDILIDTLNHNPHHFETSVNQLEKEYQEAEQEIKSLKKKFRLDTE